MRTIWGPILIIVVLGGPGRAAAEEPAAGQGDVRQISHAGQVGVHLALGTGYRVVAPYDDEFCGSVDEVCLGRSPVSLDLGLSYGINQKLEVLIEMRVGLERDFGATVDAAGPRLRSYAPGVKVYISDVGVTKFFSTLQLVVDTTDFAQNPETDYAIKQTNGLQLDVHETVGLFFFFGEVVGWDRWLRFEMEGGIGLQARFP
jgi:hypothetical protein